MDIQEDLNVDEWKVQVETKQRLEKRKEEIQMARTIGKIIVAIIVLSGFRIEYQEVSPVDNMRCEHVKSYAWGWIKKRTMLYWVIPRAYGYETELWCAKDNNGDYYPFYREEDY